MITNLPDVRVSKAESQKRRSAGALLRREYRRCLYLSETARRKKSDVENEGEGKDHLRIFFVKTRESFLG